MENPPKVYMMSKFIVPVVLPLSKGHCDIATLDEK